MQVSTESEQNLSVSSLNRLPLAFTDNHQIQNYSGSGLVVNARNILITGSTFIVSLPCELYKHLMIVHILSARTIICLPILGK
jgi:hypothetical protein